MGLNQVLTLFLLHSNFQFVFFSFCCIFFHTIVCLNFCFVRYVLIGYSLNFNFNTFHSWLSSSEKCTTGKKTEEVKSFLFHFFSPLFLGFFLFLFHWGNILVFDCFLRLIFTIFVLCCPNTRFVSMTMAVCFILM